MRRPTPGRPQSTTRAQLSVLALDLFTEHGFEATSLDDIAAAAGIARRTLFRYYPSKNAIPWGDFDEHVADLRQRLAAFPADLPLGETLRRALVEFNEVPPGELAHHRQRMELVLKTPTLQGHAMIMYADWRAVIAEHVAQRLGLQPGDHLPQTVAWLMLGTALAAYEQWLDDPDSDLLRLLDEGWQVVAGGLIGTDATAPAPPPR